MDCVPSGNYDIVESTGNYIATIANDIEPANAEFRLLKCEGNNLKNLLFGFELRINFII
jgi:hypothetical protein